jgi:hypothetical protein
MTISVATVAVWLAFAGAPPAPAPQPQPTKCCGECGGTGMVWTGDRLARVPCPCPPTCPCAKNRPKPAAQAECKGGACRTQ